MSSPQTIISLLHEMEQTVLDREHEIELIEADFRKVSDAYLDPVYRSRHKTAWKRSAERQHKLAEQLDARGRQIDREQPPYVSLGRESFSRNHPVPDTLVVGRLHLRARTREFDLPAELDFPFTRPVSVNTGQDLALLQGLMLRLLSALPVGSCQFTIYDPETRGEAVRPFLPLQRFSEVFPDRRVLTDAKELQNALQRLQIEMDCRVQTVFTDDYPNWADYHRYSRSEKVLNYLVLILLIPPEELGDEAVTAVNYLAKNGERCGILTIFSSQEVDPEAYLGREQARRRAQVLREHAAPISSLWEEIGGPLLRLQPQVSPYPLPRREELEILVRDYAHQIGLSLQLEGYLEQKDFFAHSSRDGLRIPLGNSREGNCRTVLPLGNEVVHALIGGKTGSGKSNLLHVLLLNLCWRYSPQELELYLMDFKDGVEFMTYADPPPPQARLVAVQADPVYARSVLEYLVQEKTRRNRSFQEAGVKDFAAYRRLHPLPRILIVIDEFQNLFCTAGVPSLLETLAREGRSAGIHMVLATQTLDGFSMISESFPVIRAQFGGRIALPCDATVSGSILGDLNNDAAAGLAIPEAVMNLNNGAREKNVFFRIPEAKVEVLRSFLQKIAGRWNREGHKSETKIFAGQMAAFTPRSFAASDKLTLELGRRFTFVDAPFRVTLPGDGNGNLLVIAPDEPVRNGILQAVLSSAAASAAVREVILVSTHARRFCTGQKTVCLSTGAELAQHLRENPGGRRCVILDGINLTGALGWVSYGKLPEDAEMVKSWIDGAKDEHGSSIVAVYSTVEDSRQRLPYDAIQFVHKVAYGLSNTDLQRNFGTDFQIGESLQKKRTALYLSGPEKQEFLPYLLNSEEKTT